MGCAQSISKSHATHATQQKNTQNESVCSVQPIRRTSENVRTSKLMASIHEQRLRDSDKYNITQRIQQQQDLDRKVREQERKNRLHHQIVKDIIN